MALSDLPYIDADSQNEEDEISAPDYAISFVLEKTGTHGTLYVGECRKRNSRIAYNVNNDTLAEEKNPDVHLMVAWPIFYNRINRGTFTAFNPLTGQKVHDYSWSWFGPTGLFKKFWSDRDLMYRNAGQRVEADLLLSITDKQKLSSCLPVIISGSRLLPSKISYALGTDSDPLTCEFLTITSRLPIDQDNMTMPLESDNPYQWYAGHLDDIAISRTDYEKSPYKEAPYTVIYPPVATKALYDKYFAGQPGALEYIRISDRKFEYATGLVEYRRTLFGLKIRKRF